MTIQSSSRQMKVAFGNGFIPWYVFCAIDDCGIVLAKTFGADEERCKKDLQDAIDEAMSVSYDNSQI